MKKFFGNDKKIASFFLIMFFFSVLTLFVDYKLAIFEIVIILIAYIYFYYTSLVHQGRVSKYFDVLNPYFNSRSRETLELLPIPIAVINNETKIVWHNVAFRAANDKKRAYNKKLLDISSGFNLLAAGANMDSGIDVTIGKKRFTVYISAASSAESAAQILHIVYFIEKTELAELRSNFNKKRPVVSLIIVDNYDDTRMTNRDGENIAAFASMDSAIVAWAKRTDGVLRNVGSGRYLFIFEEQNLQSFIATKFDILDTIRNITLNNKIPATISIGVGRGSESLSENHEYAKQALDMALARGGDQAAIKTNGDFEFFGGTSMSIEKRTKVKSRVMAGAMTELFESCSNVIIMGHRYADFDAVGACIGVARIAITLKKDFHIVINEKTCLALPIVENMRLLDLYRHAFVSSESAIDLISQNTVLIICDCHSLDTIETPELLQNIPKVMIIDHHRKKADHIQDVDLSYQDPYSSSACELVSELVAYIDVNAEITKDEAQAMLAGIVLDTKNFYIRTGYRTFEAAAFLKRSGADPISVKKLFQSDHESFIRRVEVITNAKFYLKKFAISVFEGEQQKNSKVLMSQAADDLLNIEDVEASFVAYILDDAVFVSSRSLGYVNVQLIMERLGGGGNLNNAAAKLDCTIEETELQLKTAIDEYLQDTKKDTKN